MRSLVAVLAAAAIASTAQAAAPAKPAAAAKPAGAAQPLKIANFDARDPDKMIALLTALGAQAKVTGRESGQVFLAVVTPGGEFGAQMIGCDGGGKACHAIALFSTYEKKGATLAQINDFNRSQLACRGILTPDGRPSVMYSTLVNLRMTADETRQHIGVWQGCLTGFSEFTTDPIDFLSRPHG
ncbi:MAG TPA: YbjN domain-containing protein [Phenylobacterium sp.]|nr:YbjN domain-containing protein [Phenylobacterium sp.]